MKCPHCNTGIHESFSTTAGPSQPHFDDLPANFGRSMNAANQWHLLFQTCPECRKSIIYLQLKHGANVAYKYLAYPQNALPRPLDAAVLEPYRADFVEACQVLPLSPKASAALSRRCLQAILKDKFGAKSKDLFDQIEEAIASGKLPSNITEGLHAVRSIGNFAAHLIKSTNTGEIVDVEPGEAEWNLDVLESLFDFYFVQPAITAKRKADLNVKLAAAGKPQLP